MAIVEGRKGVKWSYVQLWFVFPLFLPTHICSSKSKSLPLLLTRVVSPPLSSRGDLSARDSLDTPLLFAPALILHARVYPYVKTEKGLWSRICIEFIKKKRNASGKKCALSSLDVRQSSFCARVLIVSVGTLVHSTEIKTHWSSTRFLDLGERDKGLRIHRIESSWIISRRAKRK